jgi:tripartite-type tricarboxylate transporter receptor subunit TctC
MNVSRLPAPLLVAAILSPLLAGAPGFVIAQPAWPAKPIRLIVPFSWRG